MLFYTTQRTNPVVPESPKKWHSLFGVPANIRESKSAKEFAFCIAFDRKKVRMTSGKQNATIARLPVYFEQTAIIY